MSTDDRQEIARHPVLQTLMHKHVLSGLMFVGIAIFGLWVSRDYPIGTALRMGTGYVPRLLCWCLLALGCLILFQGLRESRPRAAFSNDPSRPDAHRDEQQVGAWGWRALVCVTASLVIFGLALETLGLVISILLLTGVGALAAPGLRPLETVAAAAVLIALSWAIFILGLGLTIPVWPEW
jgi:putative tricarboxylic transport membrane protein